MFCSKTKKSGGTGINDVMCSLAESCFKLINEVLKNAILPIRFLVFSGCGRGLPSCQVCRLDSEESLFSLPHYSWWPQRGGDRGRLTSASEAHLQKQNQTLLYGAKWDGQMLRCACKRVFSSSICPAHLNFNNSLLKQLLSLNVWMSLTRASGAADRKDDNFGELFWGRNGSRE